MFSRVYVMGISEQSGTVLGGDDLPRLWLREGSAKETAAGVVEDSVGALALVGVLSGCAASAAAAVVGPFGRTAATATRAHQPRSRSHRH